MFRRQLEESALILSPIHFITLDDIISSKIVNNFFTLYYSVTTAKKRHLGAKLGKWKKYVHLTLSLKKNLNFSFVPFLLQYHCVIWLNVFRGISSLSYKRVCHSTENTSNRRNCWFEVFEIFINLRELQDMYGANLSTIPYVSRYAGMFSKVFANGWSMSKSFPPIGIFQIFQQYSIRKNYNKKI